jgi:hypothetical protein
VEFDGRHRKIHGMGRKRKEAAETEETAPKRQRTKTTASKDGNAVQVAGAAGALELITSRSTGSNNQPAYIAVGGFTFADVRAVAPPPPPPGNTPSVSVDPSASSLVDGAAVPQTQVCPGCKVFRRKYDNLACSHDRLCRFLFPDWRRWSAILQS